MVFTARNRKIKEREYKTIMNNKEAIRLLSAVIEYLNLEKENGSTNSIVDLSNLVISLELFDKNETQDEFNDRVKLISVMYLPKRPRAIMWKTPQCAIIIGKDKYGLVRCYKIFQNDNVIYEEPVLNDYKTMLNDEE